jgi:DNA-binding winged helix-turn-helix (wHTH) protein/tetratricopeptide (TPR) repeat protein
LNAGERLNGTVRFGEFEIDTAALELRRGAERVPLAPQAVAALLVLVRNGGELVTREALYAELWPDPDVDVDRGLNTLIRQIRIALGDDATDPTFIRTYPRRGYRFLVRPSERSEAPALPSRERAGRTAAVAGVAAAVVIAVAVGSRLLDRRGQSRDTRMADDTVAADFAVADLDAGIRERFLEGEFLLEQGSPARRAQAVEPLEEVVLAAPAFAGAHALLADALFWAGRYEDARAAAQSALALKPDEPRALVVRGTVRLIRDWDPDGAETDLREAVRLAGAEPEPHHALAFALATAGHHTDAIQELKRAHSLDPVSAVVTGDLGLIHLYAGDLASAAEYCERAAVLEPDAAWAAECAFDALAHLGRHEAARPFAERIVGWSGESPAAVLGAADDPAARTTQRFRAWRADQAVRALAGGGSAMGAALALADAGRRREAVAALGLAAEDRGPGLITITVDPRFRSLRDEPGFRELAADLARHGFARLPS